MLTAAPHKGFPVPACALHVFHHKGKALPLQASRAKTKGGLRRLLFRIESRLFLGVFLTEFFHAAGGIEHLLLTGVKRMALRAHFDMQIPTHGRTRLKLIAATASNGNFSVIRMDFRFHRQILTGVFRPEAGEKGRYYP
jgi:hypothetical protein